MKTIVLLKKADLFIQVLLAGMIFLSMLVSNGEKGLLLLLIGWQLFSAALHLVFRSAFYASIHRRYAFILMALLVACIFYAFILLSPVVFFPAFFGLVALIPYYMYTCLDELKILNKKMIVHLK